MKPCCSLVSILCVCRHFQTDSVMTFSTIIPGTKVKLKSLQFSKIILLVKLNIELCFRLLALLSNFLKIAAKNFAIICTTAFRILCCWSLGHADLNAIQLLPTSTYFVSVQGIIGSYLTTLHIGERRRLRINLKAFPSNWLKFNFLKPIVILDFFIFLSFLKIPNFYKEFFFSLSTVEIIVLDLPKQRNIYSLKSVAFR